jgi:hypothetical protein
MTLRKVNRLVWSLAMGASLLTGPAASGHDQGTYVPLYWTQSTVGWKFAPTFPTGLYRTRMTDSATRWNSVGSVNFTFDHNGEGAPGQLFNDPCGNDYNAVVWSNLPQIQMGAVRVCLSPTSGAITRFVLAIEDRGDWKTSNGDPGTHYLESVGTHEFGHAWGFGTGIYTNPPGPVHFESGLVVCVNDSTYHTMCNGLLPAPSKMMSLELHDIETFQNRY